MDNFDEQSIEFQNQREQELFAFARMGIKAQELFDSEVGHYLVGRAAQDIDAIKDQILNTAPWRKRRIRQLQNKAEAVKLGIKYLREAINEGQQAEQSLMEARE